MFETGFGSDGRNLFRAPFQNRFDFAVQKNFKITERVNLKYEADFFNSSIIRASTLRKITSR